MPPTDEETDWADEVESELVRQMLNRMFGTPARPRPENAVTRALAAWICRKQMGAPMGIDAVKYVRLKPQPVAA